MLMAHAVNAETKGTFREVHLSEEDLQELEMAAWLHDCGKITTPEYVVDKRTKLETIFDRIELVEARLELLTGAVQGDIISRKDYDDIREFLRQVNTGTESLPDEQVERIRQLARLQVRRADGSTRNLLTDDEVNNLCINKGTLTGKERETIQNHIVATINMLESLPFPDHLRKVPAIAGAHHERLDGKGYPRGLSAEELSLQARMLALADTFEALTASDRPYRRPLPLSKALKIVGDMSQQGHLDPDLYRLFVERKLYQDYADRYLIAEQVDHVDPAALPGCS